MDDYSRGPSSPKQWPTQPNPWLRCIVLALLLSLSGITAPSLAAEKPVYVGLYQNPPKIFTDTNGIPSGFFIDILNEIAQREHWRIKYIDCVWERCLDLLERGDIDLMPDVAYSEERTERFDFHREVVLNNWSQIYALEPHTFESFHDLDGKRIAVLKGSIQYQRLRQQLKSFNGQTSFIETESSREAVQSIIKGHADAVLLNRLYGLQHAEAQGLHPNHLIVDISQLYFASGKGRNSRLLTKVDHNLRQMKDDQKSAYHEAIRRWIDPLEKKTLPYEFIWIAVGLISALMIISLHNHILKQTVERATNELKKRNATIAESEAMFRNLFDTTTDAMLLISNEQIINANPALLKQFGYQNLDSIQQLKHDDFFPKMQPDGRTSTEAFENHFMDAFANGHTSFEWLYHRADGSAFSAEVSLVPMQLNGVPMLHSTIRDISHIHQQQERMRQLNRALKTVSSVNHILVHSQNENDLINKACRSIITEGEYRFAWIGLATRGEPCSITPSAQFGFDDDDLYKQCATCNNDRTRQCPCCFAIQSNETVVIHDILENPRFTLLHKQAKSYGYHSLISLPLSSHNNTIGVLTIYSVSAEAFVEEERKLLSELADDLAFGIYAQRLSAEQEHISEERKKHQEIMQDAMLKTIQAITSMVEMRDPYTAGHQNRVADLAVAIGKELGLGSSRIEGLRFGGMIHDIGNIYVPAEILNHPGSLSAAEQIIVHSHVEVGYDIVKEIDFPWPIADMVLSHHERLDGSGYPNGLKGDEISLESQIIAVADITEAMLSHRPYRAAVGIEHAFNELRDNRGIKYNTKVVDATLYLFKKKGYIFPEYGGRNRLN